MAPHAPALATIRGSGMRSAECETSTVGDMDAQ